MDLEDKNSIIKLLTNLNYKTVKIDDIFKTVVMMDDIIKEISRLRKEVQDEKIKGL